LGYEKKVPAVPFEADNESSAQDTKWRSQVYRVVKKIRSHFLKAFLLELKNSMRITVRPCSYSRCSSTFWRNIS
jgi:hypothetical protein